MELIESNEKSSVFFKDVIMIMNSKDDLYESNKISGEVIFSQLQEQMPNENMIDYALSNINFFNYIIANKIIQQIYPLTFYYLVDKNGIPCLPRICPEYNINDNKLCKMSFVKFNYNNLLILDKDSLSIMCSEVYKCDTHKGNHTHLSNHNLSLQDDMDVSVTLLKNGKTFCTTDFVEHLGK